MVIKNEVIYIACPYSSKHKGTRTRRTFIATAWANYLMQKPESPIVFSPLTHFHPIAEVGDLPTEWCYWERQDLFFLEKCTTLHVLCLPSWIKSRGVQAEIAAAKRFGKIIIYIPQREVSRVLAEVKLKHHKRAQVRDSFKGVKYA